MTTKKSAADAARPPQPVIYSIDFSIPISLVAFREKDAMARVRFFGDALTAMVDASAGQMFVLGGATFKLRGTTPLPLETP